MDVKGQGIQLVPKTTSQTQYLYNDDRVYGKPISTMRQEPEVPVLILSDNNDISRPLPPITKHRDNLHLGKNHVYPHFSSLELFD